MIAPLSIRKVSYTVMDGFVFVNPSLGFVMVITTKILIYRA